MSIINVLTSVSIDSFQQLFVSPYVYTSAVIQYGFVHNSVLLIETTDQPFRGSEIFNTQPCGSA